MAGAGAVDSADAPAVELRAAKLVAPRSPRPAKCRWRETSKGVPQSLGVFIKVVPSLSMFENVAFGLSGSFGSFTSAMGITGMSKTRSSICGVGGKGAGVGGKPPRSLMWPVRGPALWLPRRVPRYAQLLSTDPGGIGETVLLGGHAIGDSGEAVGNGKEAFALAFGIAWLGAFRAIDGRLRLSIGGAFKGSLGTSMGSLAASIFIGSTFTGSSGGQGRWL